jgi:mRNA interferase MazF
MNCRRGEIVLALFPDSNLRTSKRRSALIVQADGLSADLPQTLVAMITSNMSRAGHACRVVVPMRSRAAMGTGLLTDSIIHSEIDRAIGSLRPMTEVDEALRATLAL